MSDNPLLGNLPPYAPYVPPAGQESNPLLENDLGPYDMPGGQEGVPTPGTGGLVGTGGVYQFPEVTVTPSGTGSGGSGANELGGGSAETGGGEYNPDTDPEVIDDPGDISWTMPGNPDFGTQQGNDPLLNPGAGPSSGAYSTSPAGGSGSALAWVGELALRAMLVLVGTALVLGGFYIAGQRAIAAPSPSAAAGRILLR